MQARALKRLLDIPSEERLDSISEGLGLLAEQVETLNGDLALLAEEERRRGLEMLSAHANEEAAKALILLDVVRMGQEDEETVERALGYFSSHLARCIYVEVGEMSPADFAEVRRLVETMRPSRYLDGPNDVDWIFRNQLLSHREESLYVDYVHEEEGDRWVTPATNDEFIFPRGTSAVCELVGALHRLGATSRSGLEIIARAWAGTEIEDDMHWSEVAALNGSVVEELIEGGIALDDGTPQDASLAIERWPFPMGGLDLRQRQVTDTELAAERDRWAPDC